MQDIENVIIEQLQAYKLMADDDLSSKFECINLLIQLEHKNDKYKNILYEHIKQWMNLYIGVTSSKAYGYDEIMLDKVYTIINYLAIEEQIALLKYFILLLKRNFFSDLATQCEKCLQCKELELLRHKNKWLSYIFKLSVLNLKNLIITISIIMFLLSLLLYSNNSFGIELRPYSLIQPLNCLLNLIALSFGIGEDYEINTLSALLFSVGTKLFLYFFISYFISRKIQEQLEYRK